jgi:hypothetical protein
MLALRLTITVAGIFMGTATAFAEDDHHHDAHTDSAGITNAPDDVSHDMDGSDTGDSGGGAGETAEESVAVTESEMNDINSDY